MEKKTILVVDDEEIIRTLSHEVLSEEGYRVIEAQDGRDAIEMIERETPDLVILDIQMARMDGMEALPHILKKQRNIPIILYTGYPSHREEFMVWAADAFVTKSSDSTELKEKVQELLSGKSQ